MKLKKNGRKEDLHQRYYQVANQEEFAHEPLRIEHYPRQRNVIIQKKKISWQQDNSESNNNNNNNNKNKAR